jgi:hypothetical protein
MDPRVRLLLCLFCSGLSGCPEDEHPTPPKVEPEYGDVCRYVTCSGKGMCHDEDGWPACACQVGYGGEDCSACETGFHLDWKGRCLPDVSCAGQARNPCGSHGSCEDRSGVIECACDQGYEGPRCTLCASGYGRSEDDECLLLVLGEGGGGVSQIPPRDRPDAGGSEEPPKDDKPDGGPDASPGDESCTEDSCHERGHCDDSSGELECTCDEGYTGGACETCETGYVRNGADCVAIVPCMTTSCGGHGGCDDATGLPICSCDEGYTGASCSECAPGFHETPEGVCAPGEPCTQGGEPRTIAFDGLTGFPTPSDNCLTPVPLTLAEVTLESISGDGDVWACSPSTFYGLPTQHVLLEAGTLGPAAISFSGPIHSLSFDYGAKSALTLELLGDGVMVQTLSAARWTSGAVSLTFTNPITKLELRSTGGFTNKIGIDNLVHSPPACE